MKGSEERGRDEVRWEKDRERQREDKADLASLSSMRLYRRLSPLDDLSVIRRALIGSARALKELIR